MSETPSSQLPNRTLPPVLAAGVLIMTRQPAAQFLLMRHPDRWDLPKGHAEPGETPRQTALRELAEETGFDSADVTLDPEFEFQLEYPVRYPDSPQPRQKRVHYFLGWIDGPRDVACSEHSDFRWFAWQTPPPPIQFQTVDPLLKAVERFLQR